MTSTTKTINYNGKMIDVIFINHCIGTRSGFAHISEFSLMNEYGCRAAARTNYINRIWESYTYQTTMRKAVYNAIDELKQTLISNYKSRTGKKRMSRAEKDEITENNDEIKFYNAVLASL